MAWILAHRSTRIAAARLVLAAYAAIFFYGARSTPARGQDAAPLTLHVYANLIQIPVLVLSHSLLKLPPIDPGQFGLRLDDGPLFRPTFVRREGEDPMVLALLIDTHDSQADLLKHLDDAFAALSSNSLHRQDRVLVYRMECNLIRTTAAFPADAKSLKHAVDAEPPNAKGSRHDCKAPVNLWDAMALAVKDLSSYQGRAVLLAVTDGRDRGSTVHWPSLRDFARNTSVTIFAMTKPGVRLPGELGHEDSLDILCERTGGMVLRTSGNQLASALAGFIEMLRERYIISFPRPNDLPAGRVSLDVTVDQKGAFVRPSGVAVKVADPRLYAAPDAIPADPSKAPVLGSHRSLTPQN